MKSFCSTPGVLAAAIILAIPATAAAQQPAYPSRPITLIVPFAAGGAADITARIVGDRLSASLKQSVVIDNVPGAGGTIGLAKFSRAASDGYTLAIGNGGTNAAGYALYPDAKYSPEDFVPIGIVSKSHSVIAVKNQFPANGLDQLIAHAKKNPGAVTLGHAGVGSSNYLICRAFVDAAKIEVTLVPYKGAGPALNDMLGGQIDGVCDSSTSVSTYIEDGKAKAIVVAGAERAPSLPQVPSAAEAGLPQFTVSSWIGVFARRGTRPEVLNTLNAALGAALADPQLKSRYERNGTQLPAAEQRGPDYLARELPGEFAKYRKLLAETR